MARLVALALASLLFVATVGHVAATGDALTLPVPYRSQLDGNPYEESDCGPAAMAMILAAYGHSLPTMEIRRYINEIQGTQGDYDAGSFIESLWDAAQHYGLRPAGLFAGRRGEPGKTDLRRWSADDLRRAIDTGHPLVPQIWYRGLPGRENRPYEGDHFIVVLGYSADGVVYNDPVDKDAPGAGRRMNWSELDKAWRNSDFPYSAVAFGGSATRPSLLVPSPTPTTPLHALGVLLPVNSAR